MVCQWVGGQASIGQQAMVDQFQEGSGGCGATTCGPNSYLVGEEQPSPGARSQVRE